MNPKTETEPFFKRETKIKLIFYISTLLGVEEGQKCMRILFVQGNFFKCLQINPSLFQNVLAQSEIKDIREFGSAFRNPVRC